MLRKLTLVIVVTMLSVIGFAAPAYAASSAWNVLKNDAFQPAVRMTNNSYTELFNTSAEFISRTEFLPFDANGKPVQTFVPLRFDTFMARTVAPGKMKYFNDQIPLRYIFADRFLDLKKVAYFEVNFYIFEDDFVRKQTVVKMSVKLTPFGLVGLDKNKKAVFANRVTIQTAEGSALEAQGDFKLDLAQSTIERLRKEARIAETRIREAVDEVNAAKKNGN